MYKKSCQSCLHFIWISAFSLDFVLFLVYTALVFPTNLYNKGEGSFQLLRHYDALHSEDKSCFIGHSYKKNQKLSASWNSTTLKTHIIQFFKLLLESSVTQ